MFKTKGPSPGSENETEEPSAGHSEKLRSIVADHSTFAAGLGPCAFYKTGGRNGICGKSFVLPLDEMLHPVSRKAEQLGSLRNL